MKVHSELSNVPVHLLQCDYFVPQNEQYCLFTTEVVPKRPTKEVIAYCKSYYSSDLVPGT